MSSSSIHDANQRPLNGNILFIGKSLIFCLGLGLLLLSARPVQTIAIRPGFRGMQLDSLPPMPKVHDPCVITEGDICHLFCTGRGIQHLISTDLVHWERVAPVLKRPPQWVLDKYPDFKNSEWAPDISYQNGRYYLYYAVSSFGKNKSSIGLLTNSTLDPKDVNYHWVDEGEVLYSTPGKDQFNAIDPNLVIDKNGTPWLSFGSFWDGIKLAQLNPDLKRPKEQGHKTNSSSSSDITTAGWYTIASRKRTSGSPYSLAGNGAIEAPFIYLRGGYYYLFVSFDNCCRGLKSNYKLMIGRSKDITGPYIDKSGLLMKSGGGTEIAGPSENWAGQGHNGIFSFHGKTYIACHGYDKRDNGKSKLRLLQLNWDADPNGWPLLTSD
ncbi:MAG TPA: family 43 glycosylhydrolase [Arachidicoccus sp.]|nr:family 43 glycosylhydrolase [Arachidicoccus sp.]